MAMSKEKDKTLEDFFEELFLGLWAVVHFSIMPVQSKSDVGSVLENLIRSLIFYGLLVGCLWLYCFAHEKEDLFNRLHLTKLFVLPVLLFIGRWFLSKNTSQETF